MKTMKAVVLAEGRDMETVKPVRVEPRSSRIDRELAWFFNWSGLHPFSLEPVEALWRPDVDIMERDHALVVRARLPGLKKEDLTVEISEGELVLKGVREGHGAFYRTVPLPEDLKIEKVTATLAGSMLEISVPKAKIETNPPGASPPPLDRVVESSIRAR